MKKSTHILGIDIGSLIISSALINNEKQIIETKYIHHEGDINKKIINITKEYDSIVNLEIAFTSSRSMPLDEINYYDPQVSYITSAKHFHKNVASILIVGAEKFGLVQFDEHGHYLNYKSNTSCAAGTGSFLDQQSKRLNLGNIEKFCEISLKNKEKIPGIASRCAVFAKTDLIHAQQEGYSIEEICDGLSYGLAKNIIDTLFKNKNATKPLIFAGGVSKNLTVKNHLSKILGIDIISDQYSHLYGAIGAALSLLNDINLNTQKTTKSQIKKINFSEIQNKLTCNHSKQFHYDELKLIHSNYPDFVSEEKFLFKSQHIKDFTPVEIDIYKNIKNKSFQVYLGIDIGSTSTKAIILDDNKNCLVGFYTRTSGTPLKAIQVIFESIDHIIKKYDIDLKIIGAGTTGSGRKFIGEIISADTILDEISAHARAACELNPEVDTIIEIGGQDSKFTTLQNGSVTFSIMNNVCAAGTGSFIEEQAKRLGCKLSDYSKRVENIKAPLASDRCTVFMERDINFYISNGYSVEESLASVLHSVRENYLTKVAIEKNIGDKIFFQGATAKNRALVAAFEQRLKKPIMVSEYCHLTGALGVALNLHDNSNKKTNFIGIEIYKSNIPIENEVCNICTNNCKIKLSNVNGKNIAYGFLCGRDYDTKKYINNNKNFDLLKEYKNAFYFKKLKIEKKKFTIGIPSVLHMKEDLPMWKKFFDLLGVDLIISENQENFIETGKKISGAEFCTPVLAAHGHVDYLLKKSDYIFFPVYGHSRTKVNEAQRQYCYYTYYAPPLASIQSNDNKNIISPLFLYGYKTFQSKIQLFKSLKKIFSKELSFNKISTAFDEALNFYENSIKSMQKKCEKEIMNSDDINIVFLGRPYTVLIKSMNNSIPDLFTKQGIKTYFQDMINYTDADINDVEPLLKAFHWHFASNIIGTTSKIAKTKGLYPVLVTSFKCSPDSFAIEYFKTIMDAHKKPYLILQLDDHNSNVGYETRIEAAVRSFRNHYKTKNEVNQFNIKSIIPIVAKSPGLLKGKTLLFPAFDPISCKFVVGALRKEGIDARLLEETPSSIQRSNQFNTGQCLPLTIIAQNSIDYMQKYNLDPEKTVIWNFDSFLACNIRMFPYYMKNIMNMNGFEKTSIYASNMIFSDISLKAPVNIFIAFMFGGLISKLGCRIRPYETIKGSTEKAISESIELVYDIFENGGSKIEAAKKVNQLFCSIKKIDEVRPKVAIFGDIYVRDNDVMNQNLIHTIEKNGGEVIITPYNEYTRMIAPPYIKKWFKLGKFSNATQNKILLKIISILDDKYYKYFKSLIKGPDYRITKHAERILSEFNLKLYHNGESMENILKIFSLIDQNPDLSLFVQTSPSYCCPSLVTEAMADRIEEVTGVPIVSITYDGTGDNKNDAVVPYLKFPRKAKIINLKKAL